MATLRGEARSARDRLLARDRELLASLASAYGRAWQEIKADLDDATERVRRAQEAGQKVTPAMITREAQLAALARRTEQHIEVFAAFAHGRISQAELEAALRGAADADLLIQVGLGPGPGGIEFRPEGAAAVELAVRSRDGRLARALARLAPEAADTVRNELLVGVIAGLAPAQIARRTRAALGGNLSRALTIARTEMISAYRESAIRRYADNKRFVERWMWLAQLDGGTCPVCWAMHGTLHDLDEPFGTHPNCRCTPVPITRSWDELGFPGSTESRLEVEPGVDRFRRLDPATQRRILGPGKWELYRQGLIDLPDVVETGDGPVGLERRERPLRELRMRALPPARPRVVAPADRRRAGRRPALTLEQDFTETLAAVGWVHGLPDWAEDFDLRERANMRGFGSFAPDRTREMDIKRLGPGVRGTLAHEFGHYVDHVLHGDRTSPPGTPGSTPLEWIDDAGVHTTGALGTNSADPATVALLSGWRAAVAGSAGYQDAVAHLVRFYPPDAAAYYLAPHELWARSYAQWIGLRSGDQVIRDQVAAREFQWQDEDDFRPIAEAFDRIFERYPPA